MKEFPSPQEKGPEKEAERTAWEAVWAEDLATAKPPKWPEASQPTGGKVGGKLAEGLAVGKDFSIDLGAEDAIMKLDEIHDWVETLRPPKGPPDGDEPAVNAEDEAELEEIHARLDRVQERKNKKKEDWAHDIGGWLMKTFNERVEELLMMRKNGFKESELRRFAGTLAQEMSEEFEELMEIRRKDGGTRGSRISKEDFLQKLLELIKKDR